MQHKIRKRKEQYHRNQGNDTVENKLGLTIIERFRTN